VSYRPVGFGRRAFKVLQDQCADLKIGKDPARRTSAAAGSRILTVGTLRPPIEVETMSSAEGADEADIRALHAGAAEWRERARCRGDSGARIQSLVA
jgi:hypothetical protein